MIKRIFSSSDRPAARPEFLFNDLIEAPVLLVINQEGQNIGEKSKEEALEMAFEVSLDLVVISPNEKPPVARIMDLGKHKYEAQKKRHQARKNQKVIDVKEIKIRPGIETHDYEVKKRAIEKFLGEGNKVKVTLRFRGREMAHQERGHELLQRIVSEMEEKAKVESEPKLEGRQIIMVLGPR